jgi:hypothetical protein
MRVKPTSIDWSGKERTYDGIMRFAVVSKYDYGTTKVVALFANLAGAREWQQMMYSKDSEVVALVRDAGDGVRGYPVQRDDNLDMMKK